MSASFGASPITPKCGRIGMRTFFRMLWFSWTVEWSIIQACTSAGPMDGKLLGRGAGEGFGVHICTGPIYIRGAEPGDILEVRIMDVKPRPSANPAYAGKSFGSNAAAWWGFNYK